MLNPLPKELDFINRFRVTNAGLEHATWRNNPFEADVWQCTFGKENITIDFRKTLDDGLLLTSQKHRQVLVSIKKFLCLQTHPLITGSVTLAPRTARGRIAVAMHIIDYFLLRNEYFRISTFGFGMVTADDVATLIDTITSHRAVKASIYEPMSHILSFLEKIEISEKEVSDIRETFPDLFEIYGTESDWLFPRDQLIKVRAWLMIHGCYPPGNNSAMTEYKYRVGRKNVLAHAIGSRVLCHLKFEGLLLEGLDVAPSKSFQRELLPVPVSNLNEDERASAEHVAGYISVLKSMRVARIHGADLIPDGALTVLENTSILTKERTKERARFTTLPFNVANTIFSKAIEFYIEYGEALIDYYLNLAATNVEVSNLSVVIPEKLKSLGVTSWRSSATTSENFFAELRAGQNLYNMLEVLYGAVAVLVNTLMARRVSELTDLTRASIVEDSGWYFLAFNLRKANVLEHRKRTLRPLPQIGAEALKLLAKVSDRLPELGYLASGYLFDFPFSAWRGQQPFYGTVHSDLRRCFDRFCDYYQTPMDDLGRRYYVRAHQLRRNFAMLFFWHGSFGGIEVLRYFLGHNKPSMTYRYVTEALPGKALNRVKATVAKDMIKAEHSASQELANLICERYALTLNELHILPERDVVDYIEELLLAGEAKIEPEFVEGPRGEEYRIIYKVVHQVNRSYEA